jgi:hypothetical protein
MRQVELAAAQPLLGTFQSPCFGVTVVQNYGLHVLFMYRGGSFSQTIE